MKKISKKSAAIGIILLGVGAIILLRNIRLVEDAPRDPILARSKGNPEAEIKIEEHIDFQCPACAYGAKMLKEFLEKNPDKIYLQLYYHPLAMHKHAFTASIYAECAARQDKFWPFQDLLIERQEQWSRNADAKAEFETMSQEVELDMEKLQSCVADPAVEEAVVAEKERGAERGIKSTPTYFINGEMTVGANTLIPKLNALLKPSSP